MGVCSPSRATPSLGCQTVCSVRLSATVKGSPWATTIVSGRRSSIVNVYRGAFFHGTKNRCQAFAAAAGKRAKRTSAAVVGIATSQTHSRCRGLGTASRKSRRPASWATSRIAASHSVRERACSKSLRTSSMMPSNWSPTLGCLRTKAGPVARGRRCRQTQRWRAQGILAHAAAAVTNRPMRSQPGVSHARSRQNSTR